MNLDDCLDEFGVFGVVFPFDVLILMAKCKFAYAVEASFAFFVDEGIEVFAQAV